MGEPRISRFVVAMLCVTVLAACRESDGELFEISGRLFVFNYRVATATYVVTLKPLQPMRDGETAVATFENPDGGPSIVVRQKIWPKLDKVAIETPPLRCVIEDRPYAVSIVIEGADALPKQTLATTMVSSQDQSALPDRPLVVGPLYTPNPELAGHPDGKLSGNTDEPCPSP